MIRFDVLTLFPEMCNTVLNESIIGRALKAGKIDVCKNGAGIDFSEEIAKEVNLSPERVREILKISQDPISLETPVGEEDDSSVGNFIPDDEAASPSDQAADTLLKEQIQEMETDLPHLNAMYESYEKALKDKQRMDYDDQMVYGLSRRAHHESATHLIADILKALQALHSFFKLHTLRVELFIVVIICRFVT